MRRAAVSIAVAAILMFLPGAGICADETTTLKGEYYWDGGATGGPLEAVFTPNETEGRWTVAFQFNFRDRSHTYEGTAEGSLTSGSLDGVVQNENKRRTFTFGGSVADGKFSGTHAETTGGRTSSMGTLTLGD